MSAARARSAQARETSCPTRRGADTPWHAGAAARSKAQAEAGPARTGPLLVPDVGSVSSNRMTTVAALSAARR